MKKQFLEIGKIVNTHGLGGVVKVMPWCDSAEFLCEFETLYRGKQHLPMEIERASVQKNMALVKFKGVDTPEAANALRNTVLYMDRSDVELDDDTFFIQDLQGMHVVDADSGLHRNPFQVFEGVGGVQVPNSEAGCVFIVGIVGLRLHS